MQPAQPHYVVVVDLDTDIRVWNVRTDTYCNIWELLKK